MFNILVALFTSSAICISTPRPQSMIRHLYALQIKRHLICDPKCIVVNKKSVNWSSYLQCRGLVRVATHEATIWSVCKQRKCNPQLWVTHVYCWYFQFVSSGFKRVICKSRITWMVDCCCCCSKHFKICASQFHINSTGIHVKLVIPTAV